MAVMDTSILDFDQIDRAPLSLSSSLASPRCAAKAALKNLSGTWTLVPFGGHTDDRAVDQCQSEQKHLAAEVLQLSQLCLSELAIPEIHVTIFRHRARPEEFAVSPDPNGRFLPNRAEWEFFRQQYNKHRHGATRIGNCGLVGGI
jgi:hypothetical protein